MSNPSSPLRLLVSSGNGPVECRVAVRLVLEKMTQEVKSLGLRFDIVTANDNRGGGPASAIVSIYGPAAADFTKNWVGTIKWAAQSKQRPQIRRRNWFVGVFDLGDEDLEHTKFAQSDIKFDTFRAGGPGGQHQNTTDSAVRATHVPTGIAVVSRSQRSQHQNKRTALTQLRAQIILRHLDGEAVSRRDQNLMHYQLERGNPVRCFKGERFIET